MLGRLKPFKSSALVLEKGVFITLYFMFVFRKRINLYRLHTGPIPTLSPQPHANTTATAQPPPEHHSTHLRLNRRNGILNLISMEKHSQR